MESKRILKNESKDTLADIFILAGYTTISQQIALVKLMAYRNCFDKPTLKCVDEKKHTSPDDAHRNKLAMRALSVWERLQFNNNYYTSKDSLISDKSAQELLTLRLPSLEEGIVWLTSVLDLHFLRKQFFLEGTNKNNELSGINTDQWKNRTVIPIKDIKDPSHPNYEFYQCAETLGHTQVNPWPDDTNYKHVVLLSALDQHLKDRVAFLPEFTGKLYVLSGPRGLFNFENVAPILARWFGLPDKVNIIQSVLEKNQDTDQQWSQDLEGLKKQILKALNVDTWPKAQDSYYYKNKTVYDKAAIIGERQPLDCLGGPWPVVADLVDHYLRSNKSYHHIEIVSVAAIGKNGRLPGYEEMIEEWHHQYGDSLIAQGEQPIFIACNITHAIPQLLQAIKFKTAIQDSLKQQMLTTKARKILYQTIIQGIETKMNDIIVCGSSADVFDLQFVLDRIAKTFYALSQSNIGQLISIYREPVEGEKPSIYAKQMMFYHRISDPLLLANATLDLSWSYRLTHPDFIKASGLLNFAINVLKHINNRNLNKLIQILHECTNKNILDFIKHSSKKLCSDKEQKEVTIDIIDKYNKNNLSQLHNIRQRVLGLFMTTNCNDYKLIDKIYQTIFDLMQAYLANMISDSSNLLGKILYPATHVFLGSYSRIQSTPYSDLEFFILTNNQSHTHVIELTKLQLLFILNLGETLLPKLAISFRDSHGHEINLKKIYDDCTPQGLAFDSNKPGAQKTPLGDGIHRLIGPPQFISDEYISLNAYYQTSYFPRMMTMTKKLCGDNALYTEYKKLANHSKSINRDDYCLALFEHGAHKFIPLMKSLINSQSIKSHDAIFRPLYEITSAVSPLYSYDLNCSIKDGLGILYSNNIINKSQYNQLMHNYYFINYVRLLQHLKFNEEKIDISKDKDPILLDAIQSSQKNVLTIFTMLHDRTKQKENKRLMTEGSLLFGYSNSFFKKNYSDNNPAKSVSCSLNYSGHSTKVLR